MIGSRKAFTLIELMVVIMVIAILGALALNRYQEVVRRSKVKEPLQILHSLYVAASAYYYENGRVYAPPGYSTWLDEGTALPYLSGWKLPTGPKRFRYLIFGNDAGDGYRGICYAIAIWYPPQMDYSLCLRSAEGSYQGGWWGGGYYLTYMALDLNGDIYGWTPDGQALTLSTPRSH